MIDELDPDKGREEEEGPVGIFPSWRALYATVVVYVAVLVVLLAVFTVVLDHASP